MAAMRAGRCHRWRWLVIAVLGWGLAGIAGAAAGEAAVAVASNFADTLEELRRPFERQTGDRLVVIKGSTGKLAAQILHGAPFDVLMAADDSHPKQLVDAGRALAGTRFAYAVGRLVLWSADPQAIGEDGAAALKASSGRLAMANPRLAPYGAAAMETLAALGLADRFAGRIVQGENIGQAFGMVASGNAELGFVALSQVTAPAFRDRGSRWPVPASLHSPIRQEAVLLAHGAENAAARRFLDFLKSAAARQIIAAAGYEPAEE